MVKLLISHQVAKLLNVNELIEQEVAAGEDHG